MCAAATRPAGLLGEPPARVVIAVRGDHWDRCAAYPQLVRAMEYDQLVVGPMPEAGLHRAVTGPAEASGLHAYSALVDAIVADVHAAEAEPWDTASHRLVSTATWGRAALALAFTGGGKTLATVGANGTAVLWSVATEHRVGATMTWGSQAGGSRGPIAAAFSLDGSMLATADGDGSIRLWDVATQQEAGAPMTAGPGPIYALAFSPDGATLATAGGDGSARRWDVAFPGGLLAAACAIAEQSLTREQWADYAGTQPFQQVCPAS